MTSYDVKRPEIACQLGTLVDIWRIVKRRDDGFGFNLRTFFYFFCLECPSLPDFDGLFLLKSDILLTDLDEIFFALIHSSWLQNHFLKCFFYKFSPLWFNF